MQCQVSQKLLPLSKKLTFILKTNNGFDIFYGKIATFENSVLPQSHLGMDYIILPEEVHKN